jgi:polyisoprenoid-binding protein YceI
MRSAIKFLAGAAAMTLGFAGLVHAQQQPAAPAGPMAPPSKDPAAAPAGTYHADLEHTSVIARVLHRGLSYSVIRFGVREGSLRWNAAKPSDIALDVTVDAKPYYAPIVYKILPEGPQSLNVAKYPDARFVSTSVRPTGNGHAVIDGKLTLMGVTKPARIDAQLVGIGRSMEGASTIGFTGTMAVDTADFTQAPMSKMVGKLTLILDAEFAK